jgi:hypothetical protein
MWSFQRRPTFEQALKALMKFEYEKHRYVHDNDKEAGCAFPGDYPAVYRATQELLRLLLGRYPTEEEIKQTYELPDLE